MLNKLIGYCLIFNRVHLTSEVQRLPRPDLWPNTGPFPIKKMSKKLPKMEYMIPNFLVLHFGENFMAKIS